MKLTLLGLLISASLCGCSMLAEDQQNATNSNNPAYSNAETVEPLESSQVFQKQFSSRFYSPLQSDKSHSTDNIHPMQTANVQPNSTKSSHGDKQIFASPISGAKHNINQYAQGLMQDLVANLQYVNSTTPLAVVSFVMLDSDYNHSNLLGNLLAESLVHEIHKFGIPVIDYKTTGFIRITEKGDFAFSKDYEELGDTLAARYILGGTMVNHRDGYLVNARIVGLQSKAVVATAQSFIPNDIANSLLVRPIMNTINHPKSNDNQNVKSLENILITPSLKSKSSNNTISLVGN